MAKLTEQQINRAIELGVSQDQIQNFLDTGDARGEFDFSVGKTLSNIPKSGIRFVGDVFKAISKPGETLKGLGQIIAGGIAKTGIQIEPKQEFREEQVQAFEGFTTFLKDRFGSVENLQRTIQEDPVGFLADVSIVSGGAGLAIKGTQLGAKAGQAGKVGRVGRLASDLGKVSRATEPISGAIKGLGALARGGAKVGGKALAPFKGTFLPEVAKIAGAKGVQLPASALTTSKIVPAIEALGAKGFGGAGISSKIAAAGERLSQIADDVIKTTGKTPDLVKTGELITKGIDNFRDTFIKTKNELYSKVKGNPIIDTTSTVQILDDIIKVKKQSLIPAENLKFFETLKKGLEGSVNLTKARNTLIELNKKIKNRLDPVSTGESARLKKIAANFSDNIDDSVKLKNPQLAADIEAANTFFKQGLNTMNSEFVKKIVKNADSPEKIFKAIIKPNSSSDIAKIIKIVGPETTNNIRALFIDEAIKSLKTSSGGLSSTGITKFVAKWGEDTVKALLTPEQFTSLIEIDKLFKAFVKGQSVAKGSQTAFLTRLGAEAAILFINPILGLKAIVGDFLLSKFLSSPQGIKFLTEGFQPAALERVGKIGERVGELGEAIRTPAQAGFQAGRVEGEITP